jgi:CBS domain-containing protein
MRCSEIMKTRPYCLEVTRPAFEAAQVMRDENVGFLPVCDSKGRVVGTVTDRDLTVRLTAEQLPPTTALANVMTIEVVSCRATDDLDRAKELMARHRKSRVVCLDDQGRLAGVISLSDIAKTGDASRTLRAIATREAHA